MSNVRIQVSLFAVASLLLAGSAIADPKGEADAAPKEVIVVNTDAEPVPVTIQGAINVDVQSQSSVDVNSLPAVLIDDSVPINVTVTNTAQTQDREPVTLTYNQFFCSSPPDDTQISWRNLNGNYCSFIGIYPDGSASSYDSAWTVPAGKTLVMTDISFRLDFGTDTDLEYDSMLIYMAVNGASGASKRLVLQGLGRNVQPDYNRFFIGEVHLQTGLHIESGVGAQFVPDWTSAVYPVINGYLIDSP